MLVPVLKSDLNKNFEIYANSIWDADKNLRQFWREQTVPRSTSSHLIFIVYIMSKIWNTPYKLCFNFLYWCPSQNRLHFVILEYTPPEFGTGTKFVKLKNSMWQFWQEQPIIYDKSSHLMLTLKIEGVPWIMDILFFILVPVPNSSQFCDFEIYDSGIWDGDKNCEF